MQVRAQQREAGNPNNRESPSFTVKVEDLKIVYRWLERYNKPQAYAQVFFDSVFGINFLDIFRIIADGDFKIDTPEKSQQKATIMLPITLGTQIGVFRSPPTFETQVRETLLGRVDAYVRPVGGELELFKDAVIRVVTG